MNSPEPTALIVATRLPYPVDDGWAARTFHVTRAAGSRLKTTLLAYGSSDDPVAAAAAALGPNVTVRVVPRPVAYTPGKLALGLVSGLPVHMWNHRSRRMTQAIRAVITEERPRVCVFGTTFMYPLARELPPDTARVIDTHNIDSLTFARYGIALTQPLKRWYMATTAGKLASYERRAFADSSLVWTCSREDRDAAVTIAPEARVHVVPNGVDTDAFRPATPAARDRQRLLFFGKLDYLPNVDSIRFFLSEVLPLVRQQIPHCGIDIIGAGSQTEMARAAEGVAGARLVGRVDDIRESLMRAGVVVVPLRIGGGTRLKILEALAMECPLVSTTIGAEGLDVRHERDLLIADTPVAFAASVVRLLRDEALATSLGVEGRRTVSRLYDWRRILDVAYDDLARLTQHTG